MTSFWSNNVCCPTWQSLLYSWIISHPPILLDANPPLFPLNIPGCTFGQATDTDIQQLPTFWKKWFSSTSRCCITEERIRRSYDSKQWDIFVIRHSSEVIGTVVRRWVFGLHVKNAYIPKAGVVDFFCVHPAWKRKNIGRTLLCLIHNLTPRPFPPHLMLWESYLPTIPPAAAGTYWKKECIVGKLPALSQDEQEYAWNKLKEGRSIWSEYKKSEDIHIYALGKGYIIIWDTWHCRIPQGDRIGIILACTPEYIHEIVRSPFGLLLSDTKYEGWEFNGPFQWGMYNMNTGFVSTQIPLLHWT